MANRLLVQAPSGRVPQARAEINEVETLLSSLGPLGVALVRAVNATGVKFHAADSQRMNRRGAGAYYTNRNRFRHQLGLPLTERFNYYVHEAGGHARQRANNPLFARIIDNMVDWKWEEAIFSAHDFIRLREIEEIGAFTTQAYFGALAYQKTDNIGFVSAMMPERERGRITPLSRRVRSMALAGKSAEKIRNDIAQTVMDTSATMPSLFNVFHRVTVRDLYQMDALATYLEHVPRLGATDLNRIDVTPDAMVGVLMLSTLPEDVAKDVVKGYCGPLITSSRVKKLMQLRQIRPEKRPALSISLP